MKLYVYKYNSDYVVISDNNFIAGSFGLTINNAINMYFKSSWNITTSSDGYWLNFTAKNKPILEIDSEINPEYFI